MPRMSRNNQFNMLDKKQTLTYVKKSRLSSSKIKEFQYKYYKYKQLMARVQNKIFDELNQKWEFDSRKQEVKLHKQCFEKMTDKLEKITEKLAYYAHQLKKAGYDVSSKNVEILGSYERNQKFRR